MGPPIPGTVPPFPHYPTTPAAVTESAAGILLSAGQTDRVGATMQAEARQAQATVAGDLEVPLAQVPPPVTMTADELAGAARFAAGAVSKFAVAITDYNNGVDRLNKQWNGLAPGVTPQDRNALRKKLIGDEARLEQRLDDEAVGVSAMLERGPNPRDIKTLESEGLMPTKDFQLGTAVDAPPVVKVGNQYVVMGSDENEHIQVIPNDDGSLTIRVGTMVNGSLQYRTERVPAGQTSLEIRSYDGDDVIEVPPEVNLNIRAYTGAGDDNYFGGGHPGYSVGGSGNDRIDLGEGDDTAFGGDGHDTILGGAGKDVIDGQGGHDTVEGGGEYDIVYGGRGTDVVDGGDGTDYVEGGSGDDLVDGGGGDDTISGGRGDDVLGGDGGDDHMFGGRGDDIYDGGDGYDEAMSEKDEVALDTEGRTVIELTGSPGAAAIELYKPDWMSDEQYAAWRERIDSDLELLRTTPSGREGLASLDDASDDSDSGWWPFDSESHIRVAPYTGENNDENATDGLTVEDWLRGDRPSGNFASPPGGVYDDDAFVNYGPSHNNALDDRPPVASLYHELSHSYDQISGGTPEGDYTEQVIDEDGTVVDENSAPRAEINSVGVDLDGDGDYDPLDSEGGRDHPGELTENALRDDLGWDNRESYTVIPDDDEDVVVLVEDEDGDEHRATVQN